VKSRSFSRSFPQNASARRRRKFCGSSWRFVTSYEIRSRSSRVASLRVAASGAVEKPGRRRCFASRPASTSGASLAGPEATRGPSLDGEILSRALSLARELYGRTLVNGGRVRAGAAVRDEVQAANTAVASPSPCLGSWPLSHVTGAGSPGGAPRRGRAASFPRTAPTRELSHGSPRLCDREPGTIRQRRRPPICRRGLVEGPASPLRVGGVERDVNTVQPGRTLARDRRSGRRVALSAGWGPSRQMENEH
jgi:hypothetical protein